MIMQGEVDRSIIMETASVTSGAMSSSHCVGLEQRRHAVIDDCLDRAAAVFERSAKQAMTGRHRDGHGASRQFLDEGHGENLVFLLAQAELPPHSRTIRLLDIARECSPSFNDSDLRLFTCRLAASRTVTAAATVTDNATVTDLSTPSESVRHMSIEDWAALSDTLASAVRKQKWRIATNAVVDWWVAAKLRNDDVHMRGVHTEAARYLTDLCRYVAVASDLWQKAPKEAHLIVAKEERLYFVCHLFFVMTDWCREAPPPIIASPHCLRQWLAYMHEVYTLLMRNANPRALWYALEIVVELAMCLGFSRELYDDPLPQLTSLLVNTPLQTRHHGFVFMPNDSASFHGKAYFPIADYHTHCLVAFYLTHCAARCGSASP